MSTVNAIDKLIHHVISTFEDIDFIQATLGDLSKAFDLVIHDLEKLSFYGISGDAQFLIISC